MMPELPEHSVTMPELLEDSDTTYNKERESPRATREQSTNINDETTRANASRALENMLHACGPRWEATLQHITKIERDMYTYTYIYIYVHIYTYIYIYVYISSTSVGAKAPKEARAAGDRNTQRETDRERHAEGERDKHS